jgi:ABC-2 type transport system ATP-binding protein
MASEPNAPTPAATPPAARPPLITARAVTRRFDKTQALRGVDLDVGRGEMFALIGPDGAGKTTFFRIVAGLLAPTTGTCTRDPQATFGLVPQRFGLYQDLSIDENLTLRAQLYDVPRKVAAERATNLLELVGLSQFRKRLAGALSGGMKQKLALASALLTQPDLLLLDEPTTGVDPLSRREFWKLLHQLHHDGLTIVVSTPYMDEAEYASQIGFLNRGKLVAVGTRAEIVGSYPRQLIEVHSPQRRAVRDRLAPLHDVDDVSLFGTVLHVRGAAEAAPQLAARVREALGDLVAPDAVFDITPSLEDVFVLHSEADGEEEEAA